MYGQTLPVVWLPSFSSAIAAVSEPVRMYNERSALRGLKPISVHSPSRPLTPL